MIIEFALLLSLAQAGEISQQAVDMVFSPQLQSKRAVCCNEFDGRAPEAIWDLADGTIPNVHYKVKIEGQWVNVPDDAVLDVPNKFGTAVVWFSMTRYGPDKPPSFFIRCFLPGQLF